MELIGISSKLLFYPIISIGIAALFFAAFAMAKTAGIYKCIFIFIGVYILSCLFQYGLFCF